MNWTSKTLQHGSATIIIHRPVLTDAERAKREQQIKDTVSIALRECIERKTKHDQLSKPQPSEDGRPLAGVCDE